MRKIIISILICLLFSSNVFAREERTRNKNNDGIYHGYLICDEEIIMFGYRIIIVNSHAMITENFFEDSFSYNFYDTTSKIGKKNDLKFHHGFKGEFNGDDFLGEIKFKKQFAKKDLDFILKNKRSKKCNFFYSKSLEMEALFKSFYINNGKISDKEYCYNQKYVVHKYKSKGGCAMYDLERIEYEDVYEIRLEESFLETKNYLRREEYNDKRLAKRMEDRKACLEGRKSCKVRPSINYRMGLTDAGCNKAEKDKGWLSTSNGRCYNPADLMPSDGNNSNESEISQDEINQMNSQATWKYTSSGIGYYDFGNGYGWAPPNPIRDNIIQGFSLNQNTKNALTIGSKGKTIFVPR